MAGRLFAAAAILFLLCSCDSIKTYPRDPTDAALFGPASMRIHPIFTQVRDWTGDSKSDGIEALIELQDQFGDPTKASGQVVFELFAYRKDDPDPRGARLVNPWIGDLRSLAAQRDRWNRTSRTYSFDLAWPLIRDDTYYVLTATFELTGGGRFFDRIILEPREQLMPTTTTTTTTTTAPTTGPSPF